MLIILPLTPYTPHSSAPTPHHPITTTTTTTTSQARPFPSFAHELTAQPPAQHTLTLFPTCVPVFITCPPTPLALPIRHTLTHLHVTSHHATLSYVSAYFSSTFHVLFTS
ncbi:hypothetical protein E2C01_055489 [Portunus trituberculatus]|uniref:Uncharacterized protein n=1 Tax=Portunus trituberculatus TaxID=210409 RepID=A0A5B7GW31_PORTR|nr:hypothetical protein [Portunus trituberculatus]